MTKEKSKCKDQNSSTKIRNDLVRTDKESLYPSGRGTSRLLVCQEKLGSQQKQQPKSASAYEGNDKNGIMPSFCADDRVGRYKFNDVHDTADDDNPTSVFTSTLATNSRNKLFEKKVAATPAFAKKKRLPHAPSTPKSINDISYPCKISSKSGGYKHKHRVRSVENDSNEIYSKGRNSQSRGHRFRYPGKLEEKEVKSSLIWDMRDCRSASWIAAKNRENDIPTATHITTDGVGDMYIGDEYGSQHKDKVALLRQYHSNKNDLAFSKRFWRSW